MICSLYCWTKTSTIRSSKSRANPDMAGEFPLRDFAERRKFAIRKLDGIAIASTRLNHIVLAPHHSSLQFTGQRQLMGRAFSEDLEVNHPPCKSCISGFQSGPDNSI